MSANLNNNLLRAGGVSLAFIAAFFTALLAQGTGRPKVLVLAPHSDLKFEVVQSFRWDLAEELDKSGKFDIVTQDEFKDYRRQLKIGRKDFVPDSLIPAMLETFKANIHTNGTLSQPGGESTTMSAKVDFIFPRPAPDEDYVLEDEEFTVSNEDNIKELAKQVAQTLILASEKISAMSIARSYFSSAIYDKAIENYKKLLELDPNDVDVHYMVATSYLKMDSTDVAVSKYEQILAQIDPEHLSTREILANTYYSKENHEKALEHYRILAGQKPDDYGYTQYWAFTLVKLERKDEALEVFDRLTKIKDESESIHWQMALIEYGLADEFFKAGDTTAAVLRAKNAANHFGRAMELCEARENPDKKMICDCLYFQALNLRSANEPQAALETFSKLVEMDPAYPNAYNNMAYTAYKTKQLGDALKFYYEAVKYAAENQKSSLYKTIGQIHQRRKEYSKSAAAFTNALPGADAANKTVLYFSRATSYHDLGNQLDYATDEDVDMDELIEAGKMTKARADRALGLYSKADADFARVTSGRYAKSAKAHIGRIAQLRERIDKIKQQIDYYEKTK